MFSEKKQQHAAREEERRLRRKCVGLGVRLLRNRLDLSQAEFGRTGRLDADLMTVSRWERGVGTPQPWRLKKLAELAREKAADLVAFFDNEAARYWRSGLSKYYPELSKLLTRLEMCVVNADAERGIEPIADRTLQILESVADEFINHLAAEREQGDLPVLFDTLQYAAWADVLAERAPARSFGRAKQTRKSPVHRVTKKRR